MSRLSGATSMAHFVAYIPLRSVQLCRDSNDCGRRKLQVWEEWSSESNEGKGAKQLEDDDGAATQLVDLKVFLATIIAYSNDRSYKTPTLKIPDPEKPL